MSIRVRFAPSPTGYLHIGGARTALYNYLFAKASGGKFILRIEDTDLERSTKEYEKSQIADIKWLGLDYDEGPDRDGGFGPYRQSERLHIYKEHAEKLIDNGHAYYCFCSEESLELIKEKAIREGKPPHYDGTCSHVSKEEALKRIAAGEKAVVRFKVPSKAYTLRDIVRGEVNFPQDMVGDFVLVRSDGFPVYNFCCVVDDWLMKMTHIIRGEDHLNNTLRQLMIYEALGAPLPEFAHVSLLIGNDRQKLSKRHGATSVTQYRELAYLPEAMVNYLVHLGWSHPEEKEIFNLTELVKVFDITRFSKSPAIYDLDKFKWVNGQHLRQKENAELVKLLTPFVNKEHNFHRMSDEWKLNCLNLFKDQVDFLGEMTPYLDELFTTDVMPDEEWGDIKCWDTTPQIAEYLKKQLLAVSEEFVSTETFNEWTQFIQKEMKIKGKFLFKGIRACLTTKGHGPDIKQLVPLTPVEILKARVQKILD